MNDGSWILLMLAAVMAVGCLGYLLGRRNSNKQAEIDRLEEELQAARKRADSIKAGLDSHFEQSAILFGTLAKDYRAFLDHFSESASNLGISQGRTEELLKQVAHPLLGPSSSAEPQPEPGPESGAKPGPPAAGEGASPTADTATDAVPPTAAPDEDKSNVPGPDGSAREAPDSDVNDASADESSDDTLEDSPLAADVKRNGAGRETESPPVTRRS